MDLLSGLLGGIQGGAGAVTTLSEERRKALAEQVKMEALELMTQRQQGRQQGLDIEMEEVKHGNVEKRMGLEHGNAKDILGIENTNLSGREAEKHRREVERDEAKYAHERGLLSTELKAGKYRDKAGDDKADLASKDYHAKSNELYKFLRENKWKEGQKLPSLALTQLNDMRRDAGKPELTEEEAVKSKWWGGSDTTYQYSDGVLPSQGVVEPTPTEPGEKPKTPKAFDWKDYVPQEPGTQEGGGQTTVPPVSQSGDVRSTAIQLGVNPNSIGRYKKRIWEKLSDEAKAQYGSYENFDRLVK